MVTQEEPYTGQDKDDDIEVIPSEVEDADAWSPVYKIISYPADYTLEVLNQKRERDEIVVPPFQRGWVWTTTQASRLVESFLMGLPVPSIFLFKKHSGSMLVIDGQQRLQAVASFFQGLLPDGKKFALKGVHPKWEGKTYASLEESDAINFRDSVLRAIIVDQIDPGDDSSVYHIFERLNTGGTSLTPQEVRNCVYSGPFTNLISTLNTYDNWRLVFGAKEPNRYMRDVELVLRFLALYEEGDYYRKPMKSFLNQYASKHQTLPGTFEYERVFKGTIDRVYQSLGEKPFHIKQGINVAAFDAVTVAFARTESIPDDIAARYYALRENDDFNRAISSSTTDELSVHQRIEIASAILFG